MPGSWQDDDVPEPERPARLALALSEASRRIERTELWELYTEALHRADQAKGRYVQMQNVIRASRAERAEIRRLHLAAKAKLAELVAREAALEAKLALPDDALLTQRLNAERLIWNEKKRSYVATIDDLKAGRTWARLKHGGNDVY